ncbi:ubiquinol cytochrome C oxidoreductase, cytochrome C1 subunit [hydrothermal vent metagenome]|uniref:Ubiquinol cytochrome C oxidoreductase, cytochrome C1 subunit n=1 Tax=hydrothermal vent metagenome TaxID=652676 RepID=A0A1W1EK03_9ZZZZ
MNKELKIFGIVIFFTIVLYIGVEPFAHSQMHKHVEGNNLVYNGKADIEEAKDAKVKAKKEAFWADVNKIAALKGDATAGEATFAMCAGCHMDGAVNMGGVTPPSLDHAGSIYDKNFLIALIKDPAMATNVDHKYPNGTMTHPMGSISSMVSTPQDIANVVAYLQAKKAGEVTPKEAFTEACSRCHANRYAKMTQLGDIPKTKSNIKTGQDIDSLKYKQKVATEQNLLADYLGKLPPDLSIIYRARSEHFLHTFIENPQSTLPGTAMPRTGLNHEGMEKVMAFLEETGDPSAPARASLGIWVILFFVIFTVLAYLWKKEKWHGHH